MADGIARSPKEVLSYLTQVLYYNRSQMDPLLNNIVVAGFQDGKAMLGITDMIGTSFEDNFVATGLGLHMAIPILRRRWTEDMSEVDALKLLEDCMRVLSYRDCRTINRITFAKISSEGVNIEEPRALTTEWSYESFVSPGFNPY